MKVAYLANRFPEPVEPYVWEEIQELRRRGVDVEPCSIRRPSNTVPACRISSSEIIYVFPLQLAVLLHANWLLLRHFPGLCRFAWRAVRGPEKLSRRVRSLVHTWLGAYLAALLAKKRISHIHVHHGYFASWVGMVAARILHAGFSVTLHGSDLLVRKDYLDAKLAACNFCFTVSEFNRQYILKYYALAPEKIVVRRLGVDLDYWKPLTTSQLATPFTILSVGRLHPVKDYEFLIRACHLLKSKEVAFRCLIAGEGPEHARLAEMIERLGLQREVILLGHVDREDLSGFYSRADVVVLTSRSEGVPVTLMEAMAMERLVLAPRITGIPELITEGISGLLYPSGSITEFVNEVQAASLGGQGLQEMRKAARRRIEQNFHGPENLARFADELILRLGAEALWQENPHEPVVLNELKFRVERNLNANSLLQ